MNIEIIEQMKHSRIDNYAGIPGLTSWMLYKAEKGCVRLFEMFREQGQLFRPDGTHNPDVLYSECLY